MSKETLSFIQKKTGMEYSEEQAALIDSTGGACVLACAGSGKTTALTHLIARRLLDKEVTSGRRILGVTFSKTGANEMDERLEDLLDLLDISADVKMKTLHAFCLEFLKSIGAMQGRTIIPEYEKLDAIQKIGRTQTRDWKYEDAEIIAGLITLQRGSLRSRENFINSTDFRISSIESLKYVTVYDGYTRYKAENNVIDFDDMLLLAHLKLKQSPFYGEKFMDTYQCVLVDEAQDMSKLQYKIVLQLLGSDAVSPADHEDHVRKTLVLIGDDDQCQPAGTEITMADGSTKLIENLKVGDKVLSVKGLHKQLKFKHKKTTYPNTSKGNVDLVESYKGAKDLSEIEAVRSKCISEIPQDSVSVGVVTDIAEHTVPEVYKVYTEDGKESVYSANHICYALARVSKAFKTYVEVPNYDPREDTRTEFEKGCQEAFYRHVETYGYAENGVMYTGVIRAKDETTIGKRTRRHIMPEMLKLRANELRVGMSLPVLEVGKRGKKSFTFSKIVDIKTVCQPEVVYGLNIRGLHNYVADGILTGNCIYEWMGSEPQELAKVKDAYRLPLYTLSTNYRCPANVLSAAAKCISNNTHSIPKSMNAHKPDGVLRYDRVRGGGFAAESKYVADNIAKQLDAGVAPSSIAVLARNGAHLSLVWLYLSCYGIKSRLYGGQSSGPDSLIRHIGECFKLYTSPVDAGNVLYSLFGGNKQSSEKLATLINMVDGTFLEWLEYIVATYVPGHKEVLSADNSYGNAGKMWKTTMREYYTSGGLSRRSNSMQNVLRLYRASTVSEVDFHKEIIDIYKNMMDWKYKSDDGIRIFLGTVSAVKDLLDRFAEKAIPVMTSLGKHRAPNKHYITLSTAHSAKGREWNTVYIVCDDEYAFPSQISIDILSNMGDPKAVKNFIEAERRLHYVAMTRARETLHIVGGDVPPGMFLQEALSDDEALAQGFDSRDIGTDVAVDFKYSDTDYSKHKFKNDFIRNSVPDEDDEDDDLPPENKEHSMHDLDI